MMTAVITLLLGLLVIGLIIVLNGFFVAQEFAYMSVDRTQLRARADTGDPKAVRALAITEKTSFMLSGAQLGITVTGLLVGFIAEPLVGESLGVLLGGVGVSTAVAVGVGTILALGLSTIVQMIFGELFPKNYTIAAPLKSALALAPSTSVYLKLTGWMIRFFDLSSNALLRLLRIEPVEDIDSSATTEDLGHIVTTSRESGELSAHTYLVLDRLLDFPGHDVGHAMIPRSRADAVSPETTIAEARDLMANAHTRYPVIDEEHEPIGVIHLIDLLDTEVPEDASVTELMREAVVVSEFMGLPDVVDELRERNEKLGCVIDEYGGFIGIITLEDLAEEILGDVSDEHDLSQTEEITLTREDEWLVDGDTPLDEVARAVGHDLPEGDFETISGLLFSHSGGLVEAGEIHEIELAAEPEDFIEAGESPRRILRIRIEEIERNVPTSVRIQLIEILPSEESEEPTEEER
ncbi:Magnesium and cobalt efflux protein CorC [Corynebacterium occultum]|uniref:Magnesium and cobalt efflux protein CorC n=1 Tax=Corynebacterium occultum TaxID=2675219 RepID=A0A6B8W3X8_9CORY|nr:hemolysin family protein [Corynebacterium occultum]QGU06115.1 Magnesium and cobalt efflux protein CorC [Corynebacterium occultum]